MATDLSRPAFYALSRGSWRDYVTLLHPPYTAWHLSYVVIGASLAPEPSVERLGAALLAFFLAVGIGAHALDELEGRPLRTTIPSRVLALAAGLAIAGAVGIGVAGAALYEPWLAAFIPVGVFLVVAYNLELVGGRFHTDWWFAIAWGGFPVLAAYLATAGTIRPEAVAAAAFAVALSYAQRCLSNPVRRVRRDVTGVEGTLRLRDGSREGIGRGTLLDPAEAALRAMTVGVCALALALVMIRMA